MKWQTFFGRFRRPPEAKISAAAPLLAGAPTGSWRYPPRLAGEMIRAGFECNAVVHRAVRMVCEAAAAIPVLLYEGPREFDTHPLLDLLAAPSPGLGQTEFLESLYGHLLLAGNAYIEAVASDGPPSELYVLRPERMHIRPGPQGWPEAYDYAVGSRKVSYPVDPVSGESAILHLRLFHPRDDHYGLAPLAAAANAIDLHNAAADWTKSLLENAARPSGALIYQGPQGAENLSEEQYERLKAELTANYAGARNAGRPMLLEGGLDWRPLSMTPEAMQSDLAKAAAAREIALAFGVPPMLLGLPGDATYANYREANRAFYRTTVIPMAGRVLGALTRWLGPRFGEGLRLANDLDQVEALTEERDALWGRIGAAAFLTDAEKRQAVGYGLRGSSSDGSEEE